MTTIEASKSKTSSGTTRSGRLFVLELSGDRIHSMNPDGSDRKTIVSDGRLPDGIVVDVPAGHIYWTNMGIPPLNDGSIERADLDGRNRRTIISQGVTHTPKQIHLDKCPSEDFLSPLNHLDSMEPILIRGGASIVDGQEPGEVRPRSLEISERPD